MTDHYAERRDSLRADRERNNATWGKMSAPKRIQYVPIDEVLASMSIRLLRAMRFTGWLEAKDIGDIIDATHDERMVQLHSNLARLRKAGRVEQRKLRVLEAAGRHYCTIRQWRITDVGREWLARRLVTDQSVCDDTEAASE